MESFNKTLGLSSVPVLASMLACASPNYNQPTNNMGSYGYSENESSGPANSERNNSSVKEIYVDLDEINKIRAIYNGGAITIVKQGEEVCQAFMVHEGAEYAVRTTYHCIDDDLEAVRLRFKDYATGKSVDVSTKKNQWVCRGFEGDTDPGCEFTVSKSRFDRVNNYGIPIKPSRKDMRIDLYSGMFLITPNPKNQEWTVYQVGDYSVNHITAYSIGETSISSIGMGSLCQGNSGGPVFAARLVQNSNGTYTLDMYADDYGNHIVVGQIESFPIRGNKITEWVMPDGRMCSSIITIGR